MSKTDFKSDLIAKLKDKQVSDSSINNYIRNLERLNDEKTLKNIKFLSNIEQIENKLKDYKPNTYRNYLITICSILSLFKNNKQQNKIYNEYYEKLMNINKKLKEEEKEQKKTETQEKNWIDWNEVEEIYNNLKDRVEKFKNLKELSQNKYNILLHYVILSLYVLISPKRNQDYQEMMIVYEDKNLPADKNYLVLSTKEFIFNKYKTVKSKGELIESIPKNLWDIIVLYLSFHPVFTKDDIIKNKPVNFLVFFDGSPLKTVNSMTKILNNIFGKNIGSSMLRSIYLSSKYSNTVKEMKSDSKAMGHDINTALNNYVKI